MSRASPFPTAQLADVVDILDNLRVPINGAERMGRAGTVPYYGANGFQGWIDRPLFNEPLILLAEDGGNFDDFATRPIAYRIDGPAWVNNHAHIIRAKAGVCQSFIFWSIVNKDIRKYIAGGTRTKLTQGELRRIEINFPAEHEQQGIAQVLDTLDTAIHETEAIIAKLKAVKQGLLHDLLTRGIDANGELRPPQAEAPQLYKQSPLGWIPKEWRLNALRGLVAEGSPITYGVVQPGPEVEGGVPFIRGGDVLGGRILVEQLRTISQRVSNGYRRTQLRGGELLMSLVGYPGEVGVAPIGLAGANIARQVALIRLVEQEIVSYTMHFLSSAGGKRQILGQSVGSAQQVVNLGDLRDVLIPLPLPDEASEIARRVDVVDARLDEEVVELSKLTALKAGLMDDLLTGRVRVTPLLQEAQHA